MLGNLPAPPNGHAIAAMALTVVALYLFSRRRFPLELTSLGLIVVLTVGFSLVPFEQGNLRLDPVDFFYGFGHEALIAVCALMVVGQGLVLTGALEPVGRTLARAWGRMPFLSLLATLVIGAVLSAFVNNTPIVVLLLPILVSVCLRTGTSASKILMPMGFSTVSPRTTTLPLSGCKVTAVPPLGGERKTIAAIERPNPRAPNMSICRFTMSRSYQRSQGQVMG